MTIEEITKRITSLRQKIAPLQQYPETPTGPEFGEALRTRLTAGEDIESLIKRIAEQRSRLLAIPAETRAEMPIGAYSPTEVAGLVARREEPVRTTWETLRGVKATRMGRLEDIIERATAGYEAQIEKAEGKYEKARDALADLLEERNFLESVRRWETERLEAPSDLLSVTEAATLGVPYGTTEAQAAAMRLQPLGTTARNTLVVLGNADVIVGQVETAMKDIRFARDWGERLPVGGNLMLQAKTQSTSKPALFESLKEGLLSQLARATGERGVLTDYDVQRARALLPSLMDTDAVAKGKIEQLKRLMEEFKTSAKGTLTAPMPTGAIPGIPEIPTGAAETTTPADPLGILGG